ncbi:uncharacterized protein si:ch73-304f21.1 [Danio aesculapii]|uniref:uncharacterized protein si:ch73-304f21.1 n=1 Tax=Danio aesculapii TaxID=1142201 RepID=UPI0024C0D212|nr:uncharacterized protein si:ch73-304f21.1 [Danio aesculapii]
MWNLLKFGTMRKAPFLCISLLLAKGVFSVETEEVKAVRGETKTLHTGVKDYFKIFWRNENNSNIADCQVLTDDSTLCKTLRDGVQIDNQTGSLTFINISDELGGLYKLQIINKSFERSTNEFNVAVFNPFPIPIVYKSENSSCSQCFLLCSVNETQTTLSWYKGDRLLSSIHISDPNNSIPLHLKGNYEDINEYRCVVNNSISTQTKPLSTSELCQSCAETGLNPGYIALICLTGIAGVVIYWRWRKRGKTGRNGKWMPMHITQSWLRRKRIQILDWPAYSPDLFPIDNVRRIHKTSYLESAAYRYQNGGTGGSPDEEENLDY